MSITLRKAGEKTVLDSRELGVDGRRVVALLQ